MKRTTAALLVLLAACGPSEETRRFLAERTFAGPELDISKPGTAEWVCQYQGRTCDPFDAELVFTIDNTREGTDRILGEALALRATVSCFTRDGSGHEDPIVGAADLRPFDPPRSYDTDGVETVIARFKAGGQQPLVIRFSVTDPDPVLAGLHPRLQLRPEYLAH